MLDTLFIIQNESAKLSLNLKKIRTKKSVSQGDITRRLEVSRGFISAIKIKKVKQIQHFQPSLNSQKPLEFRFMKCHK